MSCEAAAFWELFAPPGGVSRQCRWRYRCIETESPNRNRRRPCWPKPNMRCTQTVPAAISSPVLLSAPPDKGLLLIRSVVHVSTRAVAPGAKLGDWVLAACTR
eukprot:scaffold994_cov226-Prasinococcus_capsulatus_cf.AAC.14